MIEIRVSGLDEMRQTLAALSDRRFSAAIATALSRTASEVRQEIRRQLPSVFDRPTPYTLNSLYVKGATAENLVARVWFKDETGTTGMGTPATKYLAPQVQGGGRNTKRFERALQMAGALPAGWQIVPGPGARLDQYGNVSAGQIIQILSQLRITLLSGHTRNMSAEARAAIRAQRKAGGRFFVMPVGGRAKPGIYQREFMGENITAVLMFVPPTKYGVRFDFSAMATKAAEERLQPNVDRVIGEQLARLAR